MSSILTPADGPMIKPITPRQPTPPSPRNSVDRMVASAIRSPRAGGTR